jgi:hypothetical protein
MVDQTNTNDLVSLVFEKHLDALLNFSEIDSVQAYCYFYSHQSQQTRDSSVQQQHAIEAAQNFFKNLLGALFVCSWNTYLGVKAEQQRQHELQ